MTRDNVIPFRQRPPSAAEMEAYRQATRKWTPHMRQLLLPEHYRRDQLLAQAQPGTLESGTSR
jgi:hypothetical protein